MRLPLSPPRFDELVTSLKQEEIPKAFGRSPLINNRYLHWDQLRHRSPPDNLSPEAWWTGVKIARMTLYKTLPLLDKYNRPFQFGTPDPVLQALHRIDRNAAGSLMMGAHAVSQEDRDRYLVSSLIEEAITSSQLEGAATTREEAKSMLRSGRKPRDRSEQMVLNNYTAMEYIREIKQLPLTLDLLLELHRKVCIDTLDDSSAAGRLRREGENIQVVDAGHSTILHTPPEASSLPESLRKLCQFANLGDDGEPFVHPVIRAILLHFMLGYIHPFVDGNGRTARALFYWSMARQNYWLMEYLSISRLLKKAPAQYGRAYLYTETDDNDATYFIIHQLVTIERAIEALYEYLDKKTEQQQSAEKLLRHSPQYTCQLNHRQVALLSHALKHPGHNYTVASHRRSHNITQETARTDLNRLVEINLLDKGKRGRAFVYYSPNDLRQRIDARPASSSGNE
ncbi:MAG: Fic family protein [Gammaproteobacteria bacterium]|nr:Fic family protein [Gammaproteobacteria bacterium]